MQAFDQPPPRVWVESRPGGGFAVRIAGHEKPISCHDTEEEADAHAQAYERGLWREAYGAGAGDQPIRPCR